MIQYPLILLNEKLTKGFGFAITIGKPKNVFDEGRLAANREMIGSKFCDSSGNVFILQDIHLSGKDRNIWRGIVFNKFKFCLRGEYDFRRISGKIGLAELKEIAIRLMQIETVKEAHEEYCKHIEQSKTHQNVIENFFFGNQN